MYDECDCVRWRRPLNMPLVGGHHPRCPKVPPEALQKTILEHLMADAQEAVTLAAERHRETSDPCYLDLALRFRSLGALAESARRLIR